ncbi:amidohydrolase [Candidatus Micrarchaeota archaeon]|nr:amidohydrolase [Candidatus Micrarchaeota archaeon]
MSILIKDATIITQNNSRDQLQADIFIDGNIISKIGKNLNDKSDETIDAGGKIAIPGLVNTHAHVAMTLFRSYADDLPLKQWLEQKIWPAEAKQTSKDVEISSKLAFCEMIRGGTTSFVEMCIHDTKPIFKAANEIGMRGIIAQAALDFGDHSKSKDVMNKIKPTADYAVGNINASIAAHAPNTCSEELLIKTKELADQKHLLYQIHVSETRQEVFDILKTKGKYPVEYLDSIGIADKNSIFIHCGWLTKHEISLLGNNSVTVSSCPVSNLKLATGGIAQLTELDKSGALVTLGTDSAASNNSLSMFESMKFAGLLQRHHYWKSDVITAQKIFDFATINGAKALGINGGSIEAGKLADIVLLEPGSNLRPRNDLLAHLVYSGGPQNVSDVIIDGKIVLRNRKMQTIDEEKLYSEVESMVSLKE